MQGELKLGQLILGEAHRDATHVAVAPVVAANNLLPGQRIGLLPDGRASQHVDWLLGIVDPFLTHAITEGQRFYLWLFPGTVTGMRHEWQHSAFQAPQGQPQAPPAKPGPLDAAESVQWLTDFAGTVDRSYEQLMADCRGYLDHGDYVTQYDSESWRDAFYGSEQVFWDHYERVTGTKVPVDDRGSPYSCSC